MSRTKHKIVSIPGVIIVKDGLGKTTPTGQPLPPISPLHGMDQPREIPTTTTRGIKEPKYRPLINTGPKPISLTTTYRSTAKQTGSTARLRAGTKKK